MTRLDWIALGLVALTGLVGLRKGLVASLLAITGIVAGAVIGARVAPAFLPRRRSLAVCPARWPRRRGDRRGRAGGVGSMVGSLFRSGLRFPPFGRSTPRAGSCSGRPPASRSSGSSARLRSCFRATGRCAKSVQRSEVLRRLNEIVPSEQAVERPRPRRPFPVDRGPAIPRPADARGRWRPGSCGRRHRASSRPRNGMRPRHLRQRLGRRAGPGRDRRARGRRRADDVGRAAGTARRLARPTSSPSIRRTTSPSFASGAHRARRSRWPSRGPARRWGSSATR